MFASYLREHYSFSSYPSSIGLEVMPLHAFGSENVALVKWAPGTQFKQNSHFGGEEIFVLDGVFEDEFGVYPRGTWLRNPSGSRHTPFSKSGALIYVKTGHLPSTIEPTFPTAFVTQSNYHQNHTL